MNANVRYIFLRQQMYTRNLLGVGSFSYVFSHDLLGILHFFS